MCCLQMRHSNTTSFSEGVHRNQTSSAVSKLEMRILIALVALLFVSASARAQIIVDYQNAPPATEAELFSKVVVVVRGRVEMRGLERDRGPVTSIYRLRIHELLKDDGLHAVGGLIDVHRHGGFDPRNTEPVFPPFEINDEVVLFLERGNNGWYWPLHGPDGSFKLTVDGRIHAYGIHGAISKRHNGRPVGEFLAEWRTYKK